VPIVGSSKDARPISVYPSGERRTKISLPSSLRMKTEWPFGVIWNMTLPCPALTPCCFHTCLPVATSKPQRSS